MKVLLSVSNLPHVKVPDTRDLEVGMDDGRGSSLSPGEDDVNEVLRPRDDTDALEIVKSHEEEEEERWHRDKEERRK